MVGLQNQEPDDSLINELYKECPSEAFIFIDVISRSLEFATISTFMSGSDADIYATGKYCYVIAKNNEAEVLCDSLRGMLYFDFKRMDSIYTYIMARDIASNLNVYWLTDNRVYYSSGSKNMRRATKYADAYNWSDAMVLWQNDVNTKNAKLSAKAAFNMALACEMMGLFDVAIDWLKYAESRFPKLSLTEDYQIVLQQRKEQKNRVDDLLKK
jgi:tetratricopeptide (TPR) repeat protein